MCLWAWELDLDCLWAEVLLSEIMLELQLVAYQLGQEIQLGFQ